MTNENRCRRGEEILMALVLSVLCALLLVASAPDGAFADVRRTDLIEDRSIEERGVDPSRCPSIAANYAMLVTDGGDVYFQRDAFTETQIASITKVMTAIVALEYAPADSAVTVTAAAASIGESSAGLAEGDRLSFEDALKALMIPSGNDAALAIAASVGPYIQQRGLNVDDQVYQHFADLNLDTALLDSQSGPAEGESPDDFYTRLFVCAMNVQAAKLGMNQTIFANPHGLDSGSSEGTMWSTANDVATMCAYAMQNVTFRNIVAMPEATITVTHADGSLGELQLESTDILIGEYEGACGIKTGYTEKAGNSFAGACQREGAYLYAIVLGSTDEQQRFRDAETLYNWYYDNFVVYQLINSDQMVTMDAAGQTREVPIVAEVAHEGWIDRTVKVTVSDPQATVDVFALDGNVSQELTFDEINGDIHAGDVVGKISFFQQNQVVAEMDLIAAETVAAPNFFEGIGIWWQRVFNDFNGEADVAETVTMNETPLIYDKSALANAA